MTIAGVLFMLAAAVGFGQEHHEVEVRGLKIPFREDPRRDVLVVDGEALRRLPSLQAAELIALAANMNFVVRGLFQADPQTMGFNQEQIAVLVDGVPVNNAQTGHHNFLLPLSVDDIARIEVLRGGFASRFGRSGGGGQVNIVTAAGNRAALRRSSFGTTEASVSLGGASLRAAAGYTETAGFLEGLDGRRAFARAAGRWVSKASVVEAQAGFVGARFGAANFYGPYPSEEDVRRWLGSVSGATRLSGDWTGRLTASGQICRDDFRLDRLAPEAYRNVHETRQATIEAGVYGTAGPLLVDFGLASAWDDIRSRGLRRGAWGPALGRHERIFHSLRASAGREDGPWTWRTGIEAGFGGYRGLGGHVVLGRSLGAGLRLTAALSRTFRVPTYTELYYEDPLHLSDPSLKPERTDSLSLAVERAFEAAEWGGRLFVNQTRGLIDWTRREGDDRWISANIRRGRFSGFDLHGGFRSGTVSVRVLYTYQGVRFDSGPDAAQLKYHYYFPDHSLSVISGGAWGGWSGSLTLKVERDAASRRVRPYLGVRVRRKLGRIEIFADGLNLLDQRAEKIPGLPEPPRSFGAGLGVEF